MWPVGLLMTIILWGFFMVYYPPEKKTIPGLRERVARLNESLGPVSRDEILAMAVVFGSIAVLSLRSFVPALAGVDKAAVILLPTILLFLFKVLSLEDLEGASWNIVFLFGGAMSIGFCMWQTGAAEWLAVHWLTLFEGANWLVFVMGMSVFVLLMTNFIMNVAAIAITMPVALVMAPYLGVTPDVILYASLVVAGMPFLFLVGAAPNAIAYASDQFTTKEFFVAGIPASIVLLVVLTFFVWIIWPIMGMPVLAS
jgi:sodium-dependent dicarboxylate transporter 2/3/5